jgi:PadR family transcriptional regulator PadR
VERIPRPPCGSDLGDSKRLELDWLFILDCRYNYFRMPSRDYLGEFEHMVLLALLRLGDNAYGVTVRQEIESRTKREVSIGAIYATLDRLEVKAYVKSCRGDPTPERGGKSKRFFHITGKGIQAMNRTQHALDRMMQGLELAGRHA